MKYYKILCCFVFASLIDNKIQAQPGAGAYIDNALNHNRLIREQTGEGVYKLIGSYKVIGTSYLFGEKINANLFSTDVKAYNISISYNTYNQEVEFYSTSNPAKPLVKEPGTIDSFTINVNTQVGITEPIRFVYGGILGTKDKYYFKEIYAGNRFSVYKRYKSDLGYVSSNYVQSELRQFDLLYDYFYTDNEKKDKGVKKIKPNAYSIIKEFKEIKDISMVMTDEAFTINQEDALKKTFEYLNK